MNEADARGPYTHHISSSSLLVSEVSTRKSHTLKKKNRPQYVETCDTNTLQEGTVVAFECANCECIQGSESTGNLVQYTERIFLRKYSKFFGLCSNIPAGACLPG